MFCTVCFVAVLSASGSRTLNLCLKPSDPQTSNFCALLRQARLPGTPRLRAGSTRRMLWHRSSLARSTQSRVRCPPIRQRPPPRPPRMITVKRGGAGLAAMSVTGLATSAPKVAHICAGNGPPHGLSVTLRAATRWETGTLFCNKQQYLQCIRLVWYSIRHAPFPCATGHRGGPRADRRPRRLAHTDAAERHA